LILGLYTITIYSLPVISIYIYGAYFIGKTPKPPTKLESVAIEFEYLHKQITSHGKEKSVTEVLRSH